MLRFLAATFLFLCLAQVTFAQVEITEIMYDLEGGDTDREWVEIYNNGLEDIDLAKWCFVEVEIGGENEKRHKFYSYPKESGDVVIKSNSYAVIVIKPDVFLNDWSGFSGKILDSSFSLRQKSDIGEKLVIRDPDGNDIDSVTYDPLWGADGDGNSLQKVNGAWCAGIPTPGAENISACADPSPSGDDEEYPPEDEGTQEQEPPAAYSDTMPSWAEEPKITAYAGERKRIVIAGARADLTGQARGADDKPLSYARYIWSFGDGSQGEGKEITHTYYYPGEYVVVLDVASGGYAAMDRVFVEVISADIAITNVSFDEPSFVEIYNKTSHELDLSQWQIQVGKQQFTISQNTFIRSGKKIVFSSQVTGLLIKKGDKVDLLYPSGDIAAGFNTTKNGVEGIGKNLSNPTSKTQTASDQIEEKPVIKNAVHKDMPLDLPSSYKEQTVLDRVDIAQNIEKEEFDVSGMKNIALAQVANTMYDTDRPQNTKGESGLFWGLIGVSLLSLIAVYAVLESKDKTDHVGVKNEAASYKIIEIKD